MKILLVVPEYPPYHIGGGGEVFKNLAENYKKLGHDVVVIYGYYPTMSWMEDIKEYVDDSGIKFYQVPEIPCPKSMPFLKAIMPPNINCISRLRKIVKKENPDMAHVHGYGHTYIDIMSIILRKSKIRYIFTIHGYPETQNGKNVMFKLGYYLYSKTFTELTLKNSLKITGVSDYISHDDKIKKYEEKIVTILNGINQDEYLDKGYRNFDIYSSLNLDKNKSITIFSMGRLTKMKGFHLIIEKMKSFIDKGIDLHYIITGKDFGFKDKLEILIKKYGLENNVHLIGWIEKREDVISLIYQCDIFAVPSIWDPCPIAAFEGMACNKYIITTEAGGIKEILNDYQYKINIYDDNFNEKMLNIITEKRYVVDNEIDISHMCWMNVAKKYLLLFNEKYDI